MRVRNVTSLAVLSPIGAITKKKKVFLADVIHLNMSMQWLKRVYM